MDARHKAGHDGGEKARWSRTRQMSVIAGLVPAIHLAAHVCGPMDARRKAGHDGGEKAR
jgi:hypothetical protein